MAEPLQLRLALQPSPGPNRSLGMDQWGQSGSRAGLYDYAGIDADEIVNAVMLALELNEE